MDDSTASDRWHIAPTVIAAMGVLHNYIFPLGENLYAPVLDNRRLYDSGTQQQLVEFYIAMKSHNTTTLSGEAELSSIPYPHFRINDLMIALVRHGSDELGLPHGEEICALPVDECGRVFSKEMKIYPDLDSLRRSRPLQNGRKLIFCARGSPRLAEFARKEIRGEYAIGVIEHGVSRLLAEGSVPLTVRLKQRPVAVWRTWRPEFYERKPKF